LAETITFEPVGIMEGMAYIIPRYMLPLRRRNMNAEEREIEELEEGIENAQEDYDDEEPEPGDYILTPCGHLGGKIAVSQVDGKFLGEFLEHKDAEKFIANHMNAESYWPNVWWISDHGNISPYQL
jgi:hypothetical protein